MRARLTQTRMREQMIARAERLYLEEHARLKARFMGAIEQWIAQNAVTDAGEKALLQRLRQLFSEPAGHQAVFGRIGLGLDQDVVGTLVRVVPRVDRAALATTPRAVSAFARRNAELIKGFGDEVIDRIATTLESGAAGMHVEALTAEFERAFDVTRSKAELWARDQTLKLHAQLTQERHEQVGITRYFWTTSGDGAVREMHAELGARSDAGESFRYADPPVTNEQGDRNNPGEDYQCRCTGFPDLDG